MRAGLKVPEKGIEVGPAELMFAHYGLSGPSALKLSVEIGLDLERGSLRLELDLLPDIPPDEVSSLIRLRAEAHPKRGLGNLLLGVLPRKVLPAVLRQGKIDPGRLCGEMTGEVWERLVGLLKSHPVVCTGTRGWDEAAATLGGVETDEVNPRTLESRIHRSLHFAGEILDVCGECGGFNLQWAWSSGYVAGVSASDE